MDSRAAHRCVNVLEQLIALICQVQGYAQGVSTAREAAMIARV
jgi:hypothetical protein